MVRELTLQQAISAFAGLSHQFTEEDLNNEGWAWYKYEQVRYAFLQTYLELRQLAASLVVERVGQSSPPSLAHHALAQHHVAYRNFIALFLGVTDVEFDLTPGPGQWPLRQILAHVNITEQAVYNVIQDALKRYNQGESALVKMPAERMAHVDEQQRTAIFNGTLSGSLAYYDDVHSQVLGTLQHISNAEVEVHTLWWEGEPLPVSFRLHRLDTHLREHTIQVEKTLQAIDCVPNEACRLLGQIYGALAEVEGNLIGVPDLAAGRRRALAQVISQRTEEVATLIGRTRFYS